MSVSLDFFLLPEQVLGEARRSVYNESAILSARAGYEVRNVQTVPSGGINSDRTPPTLSLSLCARSSGEKLENYEDGINLRQRRRPRTSAPHRRRPLKRISSNKRRALELDLKRGRRVVFTSLLRRFFVNESTAMRALGRRGGRCDGWAFLV